jgi:hypothetical protein
MELSKIIQDIKENYNIKHGSIKQVIYLGVGTAAGCRETDGSLAQKNYHQFPPFLQSLKNLVKDMHISIILIDPCQEDPPYVVKDKGLSVKDKELDNKGLHIDINNNTFISQDKSFTVYTWREDVYTEPYQNIKGIDITSYLRELNQFAIDSGSLFVYHNFTGRNNRFLAEFFDEELKDHLDHIIYGLGLREDLGCYFDLTDVCSYHPFYIDTNNHIKLFNIYYYIINEKLDILKSDIHTKFNNNTFHSIFNSHMEQMLLIVKHELNNVTLQALRTVFLLITGEEAQQFDTDVTNFICFNYEKRNKFINLITNKNYTELYDFLLNEFGRKLDIVALFKGLDISGREILEFITLGDDPFDWYNNVKHFL